MNERSMHALARRALIVDDELGRAATAGGRAVSALAEELRARGVEVIEALSVEDGLAVVVSDSAIHCVFVNWTLGDNESTRTNKPSNFCVRSEAGTPRSRSF